VPFAIDSHGTGKNDAAKNASPTHTKANRWLNESHELPAIARIAVTIKRTMANIKHSNFI
jgi:hypothetical protein